MTTQHTITEMFDDISPRYDFLNHLLSMNIDKVWRRKVSKVVVKSLHDNTPVEILDVATGTADLAIQLAKDLPKAHITGIDLSQKMLDLGQKKILAKGMESHILLKREDAQALPFPEGSFDAVTVAFGVRNFENLRQGLFEMFRVLKGGGVMVILEFSNPTSVWIKGGYNFYTKRLLPRIGRKVSGHGTAYSYLPQSIEGFPPPNVVIGLLEEIGLKEVTAKRLSGGISTLYCGRK